ncbi:hypothetical protein EV421DRAFT_1906794 [Armillaria borealis]|uniref:Uncharacterized protein n=1 Tax=Armillaria borealis TaxID=47425 RepID=A0AA39MLN2_9AGAR|nr:hypothetical protein EV421DRAFT_1906794 [Armillaria borealis]
MIAGLGDLDSQTVVSWKLYRRRKLPFEVHLSVGTTLAELNIDSFLWITAAASIKTYLDAVLERLNFEFCHSASHLELQTSDSVEVDSVQKTGFSSTRKT